MMINTKQKVKGSYNLQRNLRGRIAFMSEKEGITVDMGPALDNFLQRRASAVSTIIRIAFTCG